jgi:hypothetical protein
MRARDDIRRVPDWLPMLLGALGAFLPHRAAGQDFDAQLKWTAAKVVHYRIVGDFTGTMMTFQGRYTRQSAAVTDHLEVEFDWDNQEMVILGTPVFRNAPSKFASIDTGGALPGLSCPPLRMTKPPEFASVTHVTAMSIMLTIEFQQQTGEGAIPWTGPVASGKCGDAWDPAVSSTETLDVQLQLPPGMMLGMTPEQSGYDHSKDGKSLLPKPENGWAWVITPTIVK